MKKYFQIVTVLFIFFFILFIKDRIEIDDKIASFIGKKIITPVRTPVPKSIVNNSFFKDGKYIGEKADAFYGNIQVEIIVKRGKIQELSFLDYPHNNLTSETVNAYALPLLQSEALAIQDHNVDIVSGASNTSLAFRESLKSALSKAL